MRSVTAWGENGDLFLLSSQGDPHSYWGGWTYDNLLGFLAPYTPGTPISVPAGESGPLDYYLQHMVFPGAGKSKTGTAAVSAQAKVNYAFHNDSNTHSCFSFIRGATTDDTGGCPLNPNRSMVLAAEY